MKISASNLMTLQAYSLRRQEHRQRLVAHRRQRTTNLGPRMRLQFEDELTVRHQIQEVLWADRGVRLVDDPESVNEELATYAHLVPTGTEWIATLMIEVPDAVERKRLMPLLNEAVHEVYVERRDPMHAPARILASVNDDLPCRHRGRSSGVHFMRFALSADFRAGLAPHSQVLLGCRHPHYQWRRVIPHAMLASLHLDLVRPAATEEQAVMQPA
jgi:hypothetical protein